MNLVYQYEGYRDFLIASLNAESDHGSRSRLARAAGCSPSWITRVLSGNVQLTPDQAFAMAQYFHLSERETDFFLLLVDKERAATLPLRKRIEKRCAELKLESEQISNSVRTDYSISEAHRVRYYTSWIYPTVHVACMIRAFTLDELVAVTGLEKVPVSAALGELLEMGLAQKKGAKWEATNKNLHLPSDHVLTNVMHASWRQRTTQLLQERGSNDGLHYSGVHCMSASDLEEIRQGLKNTLLKNLKTIKNSPSEKLAVFCMDWYEL